jgi:hypothetical protein
MMTKFSILVLVLFFSHFCSAQLLNGAPEPVFPSLPFDLKGAVNNNYKLVSVVYETYIKTEGDESGFPWKNQVMNYQQARYTIRDNKLEAASFYDTLNRKIYAYECSYIDGLLSAVEYFSFDSMLVAKSNYVFNYANLVNKPAVANLSWGCPLGPRDGTSLFSQACNNLVGPGKIFVLSGGNNGNNNIHLKKTYPYQKPLRSLLV